MQPRVHRRPARRSPNSPRRGAPWSTCTAHQVAARTRGAALLDRASGAPRCRPCGTPERRRADDSRELGALAARAPGRDRPAALPAHRDRRRHITGPDEDELLAAQRRSSPTRRRTVRRWRPRLRRSRCRRGRDGSASARSPDAPFASCRPSAVTAGRNRAAAREGHPRVGRRRSRAAGRGASRRAPARARKYADAAEVIAYAGEIRARVTDSNRTTRPPR